MTACRICGGDPCGNPGFCATGRRADAKFAADRKAGRHRQSAEILRVRRLLADDNISLEPMWAELNDPRNHPTPQMTIEAIMYCVRQRGLAALKEPANLERLARCDKAALAQIDRRIATLKESVR
jgi:hypothetical protein